MAHAIVVLADVGNCEYNYDNGVVIVDLPGTTLIIASLRAVRK